MVEPSDMTKSPKQTFVPSENWPKLTCRTCQKYLSYFPIFCNEYGGSTCGRCPKPKGISKRNVDYENLAAMFKFPCSNNSNGCLEFCFPEHMPEHEHYCPYRKFQCPTEKVTQCHWNGTQMQLEEHVENNHPTFLMGGDTFEIDFIHKYTENYLFRYENELFVINREADSEKKTFSCIVSYIGCKPIVEKTYEVKLVFLNGSKPEIGKFEQVAKFHEKVRVKSDTLRSKLKDPLTVVVRVEIIKTLSIPEVLTPAESKGYTNEVNPELFNKIECLVCMNYMTPPIYQCRNGHSLCDICCKKLKECPNCKGALEGARNYTLEDIVQTFYYPCKYEACKFSSKADQIRNHEKNCIYGPFKCPLKAIEDCQWEGPITQIYDHVRTSHYENLLEVEEINTFVDLQKNEDSDPDEEVYIIRYAYHLFMLHTLFTGSSFYWTMHTLGPPETSKKFKFEIDICDTKKSNRRIYMKSPCSPPCNFTDCFDDDNSYNYLFIEADQISPLVDKWLKYRVRILQE